MLEFLKIAWMGLAKGTDTSCHYVHWLPNRADLEKMVILGCQHF